MDGSPWFERKAECGYGSARLADHARGRASWASREQSPGASHEAPMTKLQRAIGLMSGTSLDGIDVALIETDGEDRVVRGPSATFGYTPDFRGRLAEALEDARDLRNRNARPGCLAAVERELTQSHAAAVARFLAEQ